MGDGLDARAWSLQETTPSDSTIVDTHTCSLFRGDIDCPVAGGGRLVANIRFENCRQDDLLSFTMNGVVFHSD
jgi:hypothetical protein